jgi:tryptophan synthase alpha chain
MKKIVVPYALYGYPNTIESVSLIKRYITCGALRIEIGFPFSDPVADGETLQEANQVALENSITMKQLLVDISALKKENPQVKFTLMSYLNPLMAGGIENTVNSLSTSFTSIVIPDLPLEAYEEFLPIFKKNKLALVPLITPNTSESRIKEYVKSADDFIYLVTVNGITGTATGTKDTLLPVINKIRTYSKNPIIAGFGIKSKEDIDELSGLVDNIIIASQLLRLQAIGDYKKIDELVMYG